MANSEIENDDIRPKIGAIPIISKPSDMMRETLCSILRSQNLLRTNQDNTGSATVLGVPIYTLDVGERKINENFFELTGKIIKT